MIKQSQITFEPSPPPRSRPGALPVRTCCCALSVPPPDTAAPAGAHAHTGDKARVSVVRMCIYVCLLHVHTCVWAHMFVRWTHCTFCSLHVSLHGMETFPRQHSWPRSGCGPGGKEARLGDKDRAPAAPQPGILHAPGHSRDGRPTLAFGILFFFPLE